MIGDAAVKFGRDGIDRKNIGQETGELMDFCGKGRGAFVPDRVTKKQRRIMLFQHPCTGSGRCNDVVEILKRFDDVFRDLFRIRPIAGIVSWLAATGLRQRNRHIASGIFKKLDCRKSHCRAKKVDKTGYKQADTRIIAWGFQKRTPLLCTGPMTRPDWFFRFGRENQDRISVAAAGAKCVASRRSGSPAAWPVR